MATKLRIKHYKTPDFPSSAMFICLAIIIVSSLLLLFVSKRKQSVEAFSDTCGTSKMKNRPIHEHPLFHKGPILFKIPEYTRECKSVPQGTDVQYLADPPAYGDPLKTGDFDASFDLGKYMCYAVMPMDTVAISIDDVTRCAQENDEYTYYAVQDGVCFATKTDDIKKNKRVGNEDVAATDSCIVYKKRDYNDYAVEIIS